MIGKSLFLAAFIGLGLGAPAGAVTSSQNVDIIITHGAPLTTFTFQNDTGATLQPGTPVTFGQAFRYGDVMPGTYPVIRDAATHQQLAGQQWEEISTWRENGGNGSWRHAVWSAWLPISVAAGATYTVEFVIAMGDYSETAHQSLSALCSGAGAHDLKIDFADVRNQDDTTRDSGHAVFRICDNIANTGRDAPRHLRAGNVVDEYEVRGIPVYVGTGHQDPLLYVTCDINLFTDAADGASLKDVRYNCSPHNSWQTVAAGTKGHSGNPGPAGFPNDPQIVSYVASILDGTTVTLDWSNLNATVNSADNPIQSGNCPDTFQGSITLTVPASTGNNVWQTNQTVRVSSTGTPVGGLKNGHLYWVYNCGVTYTGGAVTNVIQLGDISQLQAFGGHDVLQDSQGTGSTTLTTVFWHPHLTSAQLVDWSTEENWTTRGSTARFTRSLYPAMSQAEVKYGEESGLWLPLNLNQTPTVAIPYSQALYPLYQPFGRGIVQGTTVEGERNDLGLVNEYAAAAQVLQTRTAWFLARLYSMGSTYHGLSEILDEATGRIPALNNGPPVGPGGNGVGGTYTTDTGTTVTPDPSITWQFQVPSLVPALSGVPTPDGGGFYWVCGTTYQCGTYVSHIPNFASYTYMVWGSRPFLDAIYIAPNRDLAMRPWDENNPTYRNFRLRSTGNTYYPLMTFCCQIRGSAWSFRDVIWAAALGGDVNNVYERKLFNDVITENLNFYHLVRGPADWGEGTNNLLTGIPGTDGDWQGLSTFIEQFVAHAAWAMDTFLHAPVENEWLLSEQVKFEGGCGERMYGHLSTYWCADYFYESAIRNSDYHPPDLNYLGSAVNGVDASDWGGMHPTTCIGSGGVVSQCGGTFYPLTNGDKIKNFPLYYGSQALDQLPGAQWFTIINVNNAADTFQIQCPMGHAVDATCPVPGGPFTDFTRGGASVANNFNDYMAYRMQYDPGTGYFDNSYTSYAGSIAQALATTGHDMSHFLALWKTRGGDGYFNTNRPNQFWDASVVIPGLPAVVTYSEQFPTIPCNTPAGATVATLGLNQGNGNGPLGWAILPTSSDTSDFAISGNNLVVAGGGISGGTCNTSQAIQVQGTQSGGGAVTGQVNIRIN